MVQGAAEKVSRQIGPTMHHTSQGNRPHNARVFFFFLKTNRKSKVGAPRQRTETQNR